MSEVNRNFIQKIWDFLTKEEWEDKPITPEIFAYESNPRPKTEQYVKPFPDTLSEEQKLVLTFLDIEILQPWQAHKNMILDLPILTCKELYKYIDRIDLYEYNRYDSYRHESLRGIEDRLREMYRDGFFLNDTQIDQLSYLNTAQKAYIKEQRVALKQARDEIHEIEKEIHKRFQEVMNCKTLPDWKKDESGKLYDEQKKACETRINNIFESARKVLRERGEPYAN